MDKDKDKDVIDVNFGRGCDRAETKDREIKYFELEIEEYDFNTFYQRKPAWKVPQQRKLIESIIYGRPLGIIMVTTQEVEDNEKYWVIDGRQRLETIKRFKNNEFRIKIKIGDEVKNLSYNSIEKKKEKIEECRVFMDRFNDYTLKFLKFKNLSPEEQMEIFEAVNNGTSLKPNELLFCVGFPRSRRLFSYLWETIISKNSPKQAFSPSMKANTIELGTRFAHDVCYTCFGNNLEGEYSPRDLAKDNIAKESLITIERQLKGSGIKLVSGALSDKDINNLRIDETIDIIGKASNLFYDSLNYSSLPKTLCTTIDKNAALDLIIFFTRMIKNGVIDPGNYNNLPYYNNLIRAFCWCRKDSNFDLVHQSLHPHNIENRQNQIKEIFENVEKFYKKELRNNRHLIDEQGFRANDNIWTCSWNK